MNRHPIPLLMHARRMIRGGLRARILVVLSAVCFLIAGPQRACGQDERIGAGTEDAEIRTLIRALGDPSYPTRVDAMRRLCAVGPRATKALRQAVRGDEPEVALRAGNILGTYENLLFSGVEISLRFSKARASWREPVDLIVAINNKAKYPSRLPFDLPTGKNDGPFTPAHQVGRMLDLADWLVVRDASGHRIDIYVEDILADADVTQIVEKSLADPPISELPAGDTVHFILREFNRGWARYRFLDAGRYTVELDYAPQWDDEQLLRQRVGAVRSDTATVEIIDGAPVTVSRKGRNLSIALSVDGNTLSAQLTNHLDRTVHFNKNFGRSAPFATAEWVVAATQRSHRIPISDKKPPVWQQFDRSLVVAVSPGNSVVLASTSWAELRKRFHDAGVDLTAGSWSVQLNYGNLIDRNWQVRQARSWTEKDQIPPDLRQPLPLWIPITTLTSDAVGIPRAD